MFEVVRSIQAHVNELKVNLREADLKEIKASDNMDPKDALQMSFDRSTVIWTALLDKKVVCILGAAPTSLLTPRIGVVWMLGSDLMESVSIGILRQTEWIKDDLLKNYDVLINYIDARNRVSIRWVQWCGAHVGEPIQYGPEGRLFYPVRLEQELCA